MKVPARFVKKMIEKAAAQAKLSLELKGFEKLSELINEEVGRIEINPRYLYENMYSQSRKALEAGEEMIGLRMAFLDEVANFLAYENFNAFVQFALHPPDPALLTCVGSWSSYARANSGKADILLAPVKIFQEEGAFYIEMKGFKRNFWGRLVKRGGCLFATLVSEQNKEIHFVFKIGVAIEPALLQGVFSGVSTSGDPIAGREVLMREAGSSFEAAKARVIKMNTPQEEIDPRIIQYFSKYEGNCIRSGRSSSFELDDLIL